MDVDYGTFELPEQLAAYLGEMPYVDGRRILKPWACPSDAEWATNGVGSYAYAAATLMNPPELMWDAYLVPTSRQVGRLVLLMYEAEGSRFQLMNDGHRFHAARSSPDGPIAPSPADWQAIYFDGSVRNRE